MVVLIVVVRVVGIDEVGGGDEGRAGEGPSCKWAGWKVRAADGLVEGKRWR